jgi:exoribonuclease R
MAAAELMLGAGIGILRTLPTPDAETVRALRRTALALGVDWAAGEEPGAVLARVDPSEPRSAAFIEQSASLLRGASYLAFDGQPPAAAAAAHAGIGAPYAHVTAPLRRLVDRFGSELCLAISAGAAPPEWVRAALPTLAANMAASDRLAHEVDRAVIDATEVFLLAERVGEEFDAVVLSAGKTSATIALDSPAVRAKCDLAPGSELPVGQRVRVVLSSVDPATRQSRFALAGLASSPSRVTSLPSANGKGGDTIRSGEASQPR